MQLAFDNRPAVLVDDARGSIVYHPACIGADDAERWFANLRDTVAWQAERRRMYERDVDVPRLTAHFALAGDDANLPEPLAQAAAVAGRVAGCSFNSVGLNFYRDGRDSVAAHNDRLHRLVAGAPIALLSLGAARRMLIRAKAPPRRTLQPARISHAPPTATADPLALMRAAPSGGLDVPSSTPSPTLSAHRPSGRRLDGLATEEREKYALDLEPGSMLLMSYASQHHFDHGIPKTRAAVGPRISLAFRCLVADAAD